MVLFSISILVGLVLLIWSADLFVEGSANVARHYKIPSLLIGMIIIGFGTSAPELVVSTMAALEGNPGIALGNAFGSNITNIGLILGVTAILSPIRVGSQVIKKEIPFLVLITLICIYFLSDYELSRNNAFFLLAILNGYIIWSIRLGLKKSEDPLGQKMDLELKKHYTSLGRSFANLFIGLIVLILSSRALVWGAVGIAQNFGISDIIVGLTIVAIGTSLPELASSIVAAKKGESDLALGNVIGSNLFNTLAVVGLAGVIRPLKFESVILNRDVYFMLVLTLVLSVLCFTRKDRDLKLGKIKGLTLLSLYLVYTVFLISSVLK